MRTGYGIVFGYTTAQEGRAMEQHELLAALQKKVILYLTGLCVFWYL
jgi:hypothetical protein